MACDPGAPARRIECPSSSRKLLTPMTMPLGKKLDRPLRVSRNARPRKNFQPFPLELRSSNRNCTNGRGRSRSTARGSGPSFRRSTSLSSLEGREESQPQAQPPAPRRVQTPSPPEPPHARPSQPPSPDVRRHQRRRPDPRGASAPQGEGVGRRDHPPLNRSTSGQTSPRRTPTVAGRASRRNSS
jgi:hypothetical protein